ncbi:MAG: cysteine desulfurase [Candidatus Sumerlaeota bacterium]|nr:cysteine desulfurase [Candidatus Sumerlaeota bacterium]
MPDSTTVPPVYLDHNATSPLEPEAFEAMRPFLRDQWGNASSTHRAGTEARYAVEKARRRIAALIGAESPECVLFTPGATYSINLALRGSISALRRRGSARPLLLASKAEHRAVLDTCRMLQSEGLAEVTFLPVDSHARLSPKTAAEAAHGFPGPVLLSVMAANNETGTLNDVALCAARLRETHRQVIIHCDAAQAFGRVPLSLREMGADMVSLTAHKIGGPKGIGALCVKNGVHLEPIAAGGGQERGLVPGTENVAAIAGFAAAAAKAVGRMTQEAGRLAELREHLWHALATRVPLAIRNTPTEDTLPGTLNVSFPGLDGRAIVAELAFRNIAASAGSACSSSTDAAKPSHVLEAMTDDGARVRGAVRFSLGSGNSEADLERLLAELPGALARARAAGS